MNILQYIILYDAIIAMLQALGITIPLPPIPIPAASKAKYGDNPPDNLPLTPDQMTLLGQHILAAHITQRVGLDPSSASS